MSLDRQLYEQHYEEFESDATGDVIESKGKSAFNLKCGSHCFAASITAFAMHNITNGDPSLHEIVMHSGAAVSAAAFSLYQQCMQNIYNSMWYHEEDNKITYEQEHDIVANGRGACLARSFYYPALAVTAGAALFVSPIPALLLSAILLTKKRLDDSHIHAAVDYTLGEKSEFRD